MKQNIFGLFIFGLIVGAAIFISGYTTVLPTEKVYDPVGNPEKRTSCFTKTYVPKVNSNENVKLVQATLNRKTKKLTTNFEVNSHKNNGEYVNVRLNFFMKNGKATSIIASEKLVFKPEIDSNGKLTQYILSSFNWLDRIDEKDNLYIVMDSNDNSNAMTIDDLNFDESKAIPVLIANQ